jgi:hypothetical protein
MSGLNARKIKSKSKFIEQPTLAVDNYPARVAQIIDLGLQDGGEWKGDKKPPVNKIYITYELVDAFMVDKDGTELEDKPLWKSEDLNLLSPDMDMAKCNKRYKAIDPEEVFDYDWSQLLGQPCSVLTVHKESKGKTYCNVGSVTPYVVSKRNPELPELKNEGKMFTLDEPDMEVFSALPEWLQERIKSNLEFKGSPLDKILNGDSNKATESEPSKLAPKVAPKDLDFDEDLPW